MRDVVRDGPDRAGRGEDHSSGLRETGQHRGACSDWGFRRAPVLGWEWKERAVGEADAN